MLSYDYAVWKCVWGDLKVGFYRVARIAFESVISALVTIHIFARFDPESLFSVSLEKLWAVPIALVLLMLIHLVWSWATAPRTLYSQQQQIIRQQSQAISEWEQERIDSEPYDTGAAVRVQLSRAAQSFEPADMLNVRQMLRGLLGQGYVREFDLAFWSDDPEVQCRAYLDSLATSINGARLRSARLKRDKESPRLNLAYELVWRLIYDAPCRVSRFDRGAVLQWRQRCTDTLRELFREQPSERNAHEKILVALGAAESEDPDTVRLGIEKAVFHLRVICAKMTKSMLSDEFWLTNEEYNRYAEMGQ